MIMYIHAFDVGINKKYFPYETYQKMPSYPT